MEKALGAHLGFVVLFDFGAAVAQWLWSMLLPETKHSRKCRVCPDTPSLCASIVQGVIVILEVLREQCERWHWRHGSAPLCASITREESSVLCRVHG